MIFIIKAGGRKTDQNQNQPKNMEANDGTKA